MKSHYLILLAFLCQHATCIAQEARLVNYDEITFISELEKKILDDHFLKNKTDLFMLFTANGQVMNESSLKEAKNKFYSRLSEWRSGKLSGKKNDKKIKLVYEDLHNTYLTKYELKNRFEDIFNNGYYNCVSASALYGLAFEHLNIPYSLKEKPTHVYLIAYPTAERVIVETTSPVGGYVTVNQHFKQNFVTTLKNQKIISANEYASQNVNELFDKHYFGEQENIDLFQLLGIQYMNEGIYLNEANKHLEALYQLEKGYLFYPTERLAYLMMYSAYEAFKVKSEKDSIHAVCLGKLARFQKYGITSVMIYGEFYKVVQELLFEKGQKEKLKIYYDRLLDALQSEEIKKEVEFIYNLENGRYLYNQARFKESIAFYEQCLKIKPHHQDAAQLFISAIAQSIKSSANKEIMKELEAYAVKYPHLHENNIFNEMLGSTYLTEIDFNFRTNQPAEGERIKNTFEAFTKAHSEASYDNYQIGQAYSAAAVYYFKKGQTSKAKNLIAKGLELAPNNYELLSRKRMIE